ncbi:MAG TPA: metal-dependent hydrolase [Terriglobales bacterium]|nr:metal-dependent hydrolase [Terriglobales bacterium]
MEPVTHFLFGACLSRAGLNRRTALATATVTLAAEAPDMDVLAEFKGPVFNFAHHRGFTHSFLGLILVSATTVGLIYLIWRLRGRRIKDPNLPPRWGLLFLFAYLAGLTHILLDFTNNYGVRPFWPFSEKWYSWDIVYIVEPIMLVLMVGGLVLPSLFSLINEEVGARSRGPKGRLAATIALAGIVVMWGMRDYEHRRALNALDARTYDGATPLRVSAYPYMLNPFHWYGLAETKNFFAQVDISGSEVDPGGDMRIRYKPEETPVTLAAKRSYLGRVYLDWAQYPVTETEQLPQNYYYIVRFKDLRYDYPGLTRRAVLMGSVLLTPDLHVVAETFGFRKPLPVPSAP